MWDLSGSCRGGGRHRRWRYRSEARATAAWVAGWGSCYLGIALALVAAVCWASYILLNRVIGRRLPGAEGSAAAAGLSALAYTPIGILTLLHHLPTAGDLGYAAAACVLSSAVPFLADLLSLRRVPAHFCGNIMGCRSC